MSHIIYLNVRDNQTVFQELFLLKGRLSQSCTSTILKYNNQTIPINQYKCFKQIIKLDQGKNKIKISCGHIIHHLNVDFIIPESSHRIQPVIVYFTDSKEDDGLLEKFNTTLKVVQCFFLETLRAETKNNLTFLLNPGKPCDKITLNIDSQKAKKCTKNQLWELFRDIIEIKYSETNYIFIALIGHNEYYTADNIPLNFSEKMSRNPFYINIGTSNLALISSSLSYSWPKCYDAIDAAFQNDEKVDLSKFFDENIEHGSVADNLFHSIGTIAHEMGHCLGLDHVNDGIMNRGGDDSFRIFTHVSEFCDQCSTAVAPSSNVNLANLTFASLTFLIKDREGESEGVSLKSVCSSLGHFGEAFWGTASILILENSKWLNHEKLPRDGQFSIKENHLESHNPLHTVQVRFNDTDVTLGLTKKFNLLDEHIFRVERFSPSLSVRRINIASYLPLNWNGSLKLIVVDLFGNIFRKNIVKNNNFYL